MKALIAWIKRWFSTAVSAASRPDFYRTVAGRRVGDAIGNLAMIALVLWVVPFAFVLFVGSFLALCAVFGIFMAGFLASAAFHALVLWLALKFFKKEWSWKRAFVASAFAMTGPLALRAILSYVTVPLGYLPNLLYWAILGWIVYDTVKRDPPVSGKGERDGQAPEIVDRPDGGQGQAS